MEMNTKNAAIVLICAICVGCASKPPYDETRKIEKKCLVDIVDAGGLYSIRLIRHPNNSEAYASGRFGARVELWNTYPPATHSETTETFLKTYLLSPDQEVILNREHLAATSVESCEAFEPRS
jgi:hypothetical protein